MAPTRSTRLSAISILVNSLLCFVILMQMLGTTTSLWTFDFETDVLEASLQEGFSVPPSQVPPTPIFTALPAVQSSAVPPSVLLEETLFRPPYFQRPPRCVA